MPEQLGELIQRLRKAKGFRSMRSFASALGKSPTFLWKVEHGQVVPGQETLSDMARILGYEQEIFDAARRLEPKIQDLMADPLVRGFLRRISKMSVVERAEFLRDADET